MRVLLVTPPLPTTLLTNPVRRLKTNAVPMGLAYIASVLESEGHAVQLRDMHGEDLLVEDFGTVLRDARTIDVVGFSVTTITYVNALRMAAQVKDVSPETVVVVGGPHVTFMDKQTLQDSTSIDVVVRGEGEYIMRDLVASLADRRTWSQIPGLTFRDGDQNIATPPASLPDMNGLPLPARHLLKTGIYDHEAIVASRGCPMKCIFCSAGAMSNGKYRIRSAESIVDELRRLNSRRQVHFYDNTFSGNKKKTLEICRMIVESGLELSWTCELRADNFDAELAEALVTASCKRIQFGVESGDDVVLSATRKGITRQKVEWAVMTALKAGLEVFCSFIIGLPEDDEETVEKTFDFMKTLQSMGAEAGFGIMVPFPGTEVYHRHTELGITIHDFNWETYHQLRPIISTKHLSREQLGEMFFRGKLDVEAPRAIEKGVAG